MWAQRSENPKKLFVQGAIQVVDNVAALREITPTAQKKIRTAGVHAPGDGGGGDWYAVTGVAIGTYTDNVGTVVLPTGGDGSAAWLREFNKKMDVRWFGGITDGLGVRDDTSILNNALLTGYDLELNDGHKITDTLILQEGQKLTGGKLIQYSEKTAIYSDKSKIEIEGVEIWMDAGVAVTGDGARGIYLLNSSHSKITKNLISGFGGAGVRVDGAYNLTIENNTIIDCMGVSVGSVEPAHAYGSISVFGESNKSNDVEIINNYIYTKSTGISVAAGKRQKITGNTIIANSAPSSLSMGIYCLETSNDLQISGNTVEGFFNEGIDVHNTGPGVAGVKRISVTDNIVINNGYAGVSIVSVAGLEITNVVVTGNNIVADSGVNAKQAFSHGVIVDSCIDAVLSGNSISLGEDTTTSTSFGIYLKNSSIASVDGNVISGAFDKNIYSENNSNLTIKGNAIKVKAGASGISFATGEGNVFAVNANVLQGYDSTSRLIEKVPGGIALQYADVVGNSFSIGTINLPETQHLVFTSNMCQSLTNPIIDDLGQGFIAMNKGYMDSEAGTSKVTPSQVDQWIPIKRDGAVYYLPLYLSKTA